MKRSLLLDEMFSPSLAAMLSASFLVRTVSQDPALTGLPDEEILQAASSEGWVLVTRNIRDFVPIVQSWMNLGISHSGLILIDSDTFPDAPSSRGAIQVALDQVRIPAVNEVVWLPRVR